jgi:hypothetical protein
MSTNKAFGCMGLISGNGTVPPTYNYQYGILNSAGVIVKHNELAQYVATYSDTAATIWAGIVAAVQAAESDPGLTVTPPPGSIT